MMQKWSWCGNRNYGEITVFYAMKYIESYPVGLKIFIGLKTFSLQKSET